MNESRGVLRIGGKVVDGSDDARRFEMPLGEKAIGGQAAMERAGGDAVEIGDVIATDGAEPIEIEMSVLGFERIKSPFDEANAATEGVFALKELEETAHTAVTMGGEDTGHMRMEIRSALVEADESLGEADKSVSIESSENLAPGMMCDDEGNVGFCVQFAVTPDFTGDLDTELEFLESVERTDGDVSGHGKIISSKLSVLSKKKSV
jgi:hypothetical protein